jgi:hypothetical protein
MATTTLSALPAYDDIGYDFDVFLSYHSTDREPVASIAAKLSAAGLKVWWDQDLRCMPAGAIWMVQMETGIRRSRATAACIGPGIQGYWQEEEYMLALNLQRQRNNPVIPVLLPSSRRDEIPGFLSLRSAADFSSGLENANEFERLVGSIRTAAPAKAPGPPPIAQSLEPDIADALRELLDYLTGDNLTFFLGSDTAGSPHRDCDIALSLLSELFIVSPPANMLPPVDVAALYYAASKRDSGLEAKFVKLLKGRTQRIPDLHANLASLLPRAMNVPRDRGRKPHRQLIVSLSLDTCLERALVSRRTKFVRIVARCDQTAFWVNDYRFKSLLANGGVIGPDGKNYPLANPEDQDDFIRSCGIGEFSGDDVAAKFLGSDDLLTPVLFKPRGSHDVEGCAISSAHLFDVARHLALEKSLLDCFTDIVEHTGSVFFGLRFIGPELRLCWQCLLHGNLASYPRYLFQPAPRSDSDDCFERSEARIWEKIKARAQERGLTIVEHPPEEALSLLGEGLESAI